jgi:hypothetical protein
MFHYHDQAEALVKGCSDLPKPLKVKSWFKHPAVLLQLATTLALSGAVVAAAQKSAPPNDPMRLAIDVTL